MEIDFFGVVNNSLLEDRLCVDFFSRGLENFIDGFLRKLHRSSLNRSVINAGLTTVNRKLNVFGENGRLVVLLSDSGLTWYVNRHGTCGGFVIDDWIEIFSLCVNRSLHDLFSNDWGLYNTLFDDRLLYDSASDDGLRDDFSGDDWFGVDLLGLSDFGFAVHDFGGEAGFGGGVGLTGLCASGGLPGRGVLAVS